MKYLLTSVSHKYLCTWSGNPLVSVEGEQCVIKTRLDICPAKGVYPRLKELSLSATCCVQAAGGERCSPGSYGSDSVKPVEQDGYVVRMQRRLGTGRYTEKQKFF